MAGCDRENSAEAIVALRTIGYLQARWHRRSMGWVAEFLKGLFCQSPGRLNSATKKAIGPPIGYSRDAFPTLALSQGSTDTT